MERLRVAPPKYESMCYIEPSQSEPDLLLADFIYFFHPELLIGEWEGYETKYYHLME